MYYEMEGGNFANNLTCSLCGSPAYKEQHDPTTQKTLHVCGTCGKFLLSSFGEDMLKSLLMESDPRRYKISYVTRNTSDKARGRRGNSEFPEYTDEDLMKMLDSPEQAVQDKLQTLLRYLSSLSEFPGHESYFDSTNDYSVLGAKNEEEASFYMHSLADQGFVTINEYTLDSIGHGFTLTARGWNELERISQLGTESSAAFVAMWFDPSRTIFDEAIDQAVKDAGYVPSRIDRVEHLNRIDDEIIARIRQSKFLIADFSGHRNGVYFEAGFMLGLGRPVIWLCDKTELDDLHFDTRQYNMIDYIDANDLQIRLKNRIEATLGKGPHV